MDIQRIDQWSVLAPDRLAHVSGARSLTYRELVCRSDRLAAHLREILPPDHSPVVVYGHKEPEMLVAFLGTIKAGHPYVPVDITVPPPRVERIVTTSGATRILTPDAIRTLETVPSSVKPVPARPLAQSDPFYIIFTSGSTGEPKGVVITAGNLTGFVDWMLREQAFEPGQVFLNQAPFSFDLSVMDLYLSLATGSTLFSLDKDQAANPSELYRALAQSGVTVWVSTPSFARMCLIEKTFGASMLPRLRRFLFCGEPLASQIAAELLERFPLAEVWNTYGPTETTVATTSIRIDRQILAQYDSLPVGYARPDTRVVALREDGGLAGEGERGELVIAGPNVSAGYAQRPDLTARAFFVLDGVRAYRTGDWGYSRRGLLFCQGRRDNQIKLHGHRIELGDIEENVRALPGVQDAVVVPKISDNTVDWLAAFVILAEPASVPDAQVRRLLRRQLAERVPPYMLPRQFHLVEAFPITANGKADRQALAERLA